MLSKLTTIAIVFTSTTLATTSTSIVQESITPVPANSSSAQELTAQGGCWMMRADVDLVGHDYAFVRETRPEPCVNRCDKSDPCSMLTWTNWEGGRCWLKKSAEPGEQVRGTVSPGSYSVIFKAPCKRVDVALGKCEMTDKNADVGAQEASSAQDCYGVCAAVDDCRVFTWTPFNGGTCWLKNAVSDCKPSATAESGVIFESNSY